MSRRDYIFRKIIFALVTLLIVFTINYFLFRVLPSDLVRAVIGRGVRISIESQQALRQFNTLQAVLSAQDLKALGLEHGQQQSAVQGIIFDDQNLVHSP